MKYVDNLKDLLKFIGDKSVAVMGVNHKNLRKGFHEGHELCLNYLFKTDADIKMVQMSELSETGEDKLNMQYMKDYLEEAGVDLFYYQTVDEFDENWLPQIDKYEMLQMMKPLKIKKHLWKWAGAIWLSDQLYNRKYWIGSSKDPWRKQFAIFCKEYTDITPIIITRIKL